MSKHMVMLSALVAAFASLAAPFTDGGVTYTPNDEVTRRQPVVTGVNVTGIVESVTYTRAEVDRRIETNAPVRSVNGIRGNVRLGAREVGALPDNRAYLEDDANFVEAVRNVQIRGGGVDTNTVREIVGPMIEGHHDGTKLDARSVHWEGDYLVFGEGDVYHNISMHTGDINEVGNLRLERPTAISYLDTETGEQVGFDLSDVAKRTELEERLETKGVITWIGDRDTHLYVAATLGADSLEVDAFGNITASGRPLTDYLASGEWNTATDPFAKMSDIHGTYVPSATDPTFSNAVLAVQINTNALTQIGEMYALFDGLPVDPVTGGVSVGALLAALAAAVAWLKKNKRDMTDNVCHVSSEEKWIPIAFESPCEYLDSNVEYIGNDKWRVKVYLDISDSDWYYADGGIDAKTLKFTGGYGGSVTTVFISPATKDHTFVTDDVAETKAGSTAKVDAAKEELNARIDVIEATSHPNMSIVGSPTFREGVVSGFSASDYLMFPTNVDVRENAVDFFMAFTTGANVTTQQNVLDSWCGIAFAVLNGGTVTAASQNGTSFVTASSTGTISANTSYRLKLEFRYADGSYTVTTKLATGSGEYSQIGGVVTLTAPVHPTATYWGGANPTTGVHHVFGGSINLAECRMDWNGKTVWRGYTEVPTYSKGVREDGSPVDQELHDFFTKSDTFATDHKLKNAALEDSVNALIDYKVGNVNAVLAAALDGTEVA